MRHPSPRRPPCLPLNRKWAHAEERRHELAWVAVPGRKVLLGREEPVAEVEGRPLRAPRLAQCLRRLPELEQ